MNHEVEAAVDAARAGAAVLLRHWEQLGKEDADIKSRNDWVSLADRESERVIVDALRRLRMTPGIESGLHEPRGRSRR